VKRRSHSIGSNSDRPAGRCTRPLRVLGRVPAQTLTIDQALTIDPTFIPTSDQTAGRRGDRVVSCSPRRNQQGIVQGEFVRCGVKPGPGFGSPGEIVGVTPMLVDTVGQRPSGPYGPYCPVATDEVVRAQLPSGETTLLCLDTVPSYGNVEPTGSTR
jgi:hypothetical protein